MRNSSNKTFLAITVALTLLAGIVPFPPSAVAQTEEEPAACTNWELVWVIPPADALSETAGGLVSLSFYTGPNPVRAELAPATPSLPEGSSAMWQCTESDTELGSAETGQELGQGTILCARAAELAARFGSFTALNVDFKAKIQTTVLNNTVNYVRNEVFKTTNIDISNIPESAFNAAGELVGDTFDDLVGNPIKQEVANKAKQLEDEAKKKLGKLTQDYIKQKAGSAISSVTSNNVPVKDDAAIAQQKILEKKQDQQIYQQKKSELLADTRAKCKELLVTTNETIKRALLYQLSTQVVDWIQTGEKPQFMKQPGKFLEDTGRLALDRFISRVAPRLCQPFRLSVQLQIPTVRREANPFYERMTCTLDRVIGNIENFYRDFRQGGWIGYQEILKPQNNYYGASLAMIDETMRLQAEAEAEAQNEQAGGFIPVKECTLWTKYEFVSAEPPLWDVVNQQMISVEDVGYFAHAANQSPETEGGSGPLDADGTEISGFSKDPQTGRIGKGIRFWKGDDSYFWECEAESTTQPATVTENLAKKATQTDMDNIAAADDVSLFLQTLEDAIVNKLVKSGMKGLKGLLNDLPALP